MTAAETPAATATATPGPSVAQQPTPTRTPSPTAIAAASGTPDVQIACIFFDGVVSRREPDEYVEIVNWGDTSQDLDGWTLADISDGQPSFVFPAELLGAGGSVRVYTDEQHQESGGFTFARGTAVWSNSDPDTAGLYNRAGELVSTRSYPPGCEGL